MNEQELLDAAEMDLDVLRAKVQAYNAAADKFIAKVERGDARSRETYAELKAARALPEKAE